MNKVKLEFQVPETKIIVYNGTEIRIVPFLSTSQQVYLIQRYVEDYFIDSVDDKKLVPLSEYNYLRAEYNQMNLIIRLVTNIDTSNFTFEDYSRMDFWYLIVENISNYYDFREKLAHVVKDVKEQKHIKNSLGKVISDLGIKLHEVLDKFSDMNPDEIEKLQQEGIELIERLEKSSVLQNAVQEKALKDAGENG